MGQRLEFFLCCLLTVSSCRVSSLSDDLRRRPEGRLPQAWGGEDDWQGAFPFLLRGVGGEKRLKIAFLKPWDVPDANTWDIAVASDEDIQKVTLCLAVSANAICQGPTYELRLEHSRSGRKFFLNPLGDSFKVQRGQFWVIRGYRGEDLESTQRIVRFL
ncbi:MAG: hypothetical protein HYW48_09630 [Deltaproteobacteria bacterium]|nr:hypothetical protein [Deltaproteobacteria bacterium]